MTSRDFSEEKIQDIIKKYLNGRQAVSLAKEYKCSRFVINGILKRNKIKTRGKASSKKRKYFVDDFYFDKIDCEEKAYFLGFLYADGNVNKNLREFSMNLQESDKEILQKLNDLIQPTRPLSFVSNTKNNSKSQFRMNVSSKIIVKRLMALGCMPTKSFKIKFPNFIPNELMHHFIRGYCDGDGHLNLKYGLVVIVGTDHFVNELNKYIQKTIGLLNPIRCLPKSKGISSYHCGGRQKAIHFLKWMYKDATIYMNRKFLIYKQLLPFEKQMNKKPVKKLC